MLNHPDRLIIDLDPPGEDFSVVQKAAGSLRSFFDEIALPAFPMTTGSRGMHIVVPLDRKSTFDQTREFAQQLAAG